MAASSATRTIAPGGGLPERRRVLVLEAGSETPVPGEPDLIAAEIADPKWHQATDIVAASALGGSSHWWCGRAVPLDHGATSEMMSVAWPPTNGVMPKA